MYACRVGRRYCQRDGYNKLCTSEMPSNCTILDHLGWVNNLTSKAYLVQISWPRIKLPIEGTPGSRPTRRSCTGSVWKVLYVYLRTVLVRNFPSANMPPICVYIHTCTLYHVVYACTFVLRACIDTECRLFCVIARPCLPCSLLRRILGTKPRIIW